MSFTPFSANLSRVMLIVVVVDRRDHTNTTMLYLPLLLFTIHIFETLKHVVLLLLLLNLFKSENCLITAPMLVIGKIGFDSSLEFSDATWRIGLKQIMGMIRMLFSDLG